jgi:hypothetical protein
MRYRIGDLAVPNQSKKPSSKPVSDNQDSFEAVAKRLECDEDKTRFEAKLGKLAKTKPLLRKK